MMFVHLTDGTVDNGPSTLPNSWVDAEGTTFVLPVLTPEEQTAIGWYPYKRIRSAITPYQKVDGTTAALEDGIWTVRDVVVDMTPSEAAIAEQTQWADVRADRNMRLAACDWVTIRAYETQGPAEPDWLAYRQALRDVTLQEDPWSIIWPVEPPPPVKGK